MAAASASLLTVAILAALIAGAMCVPAVTFTVGKGSCPEKLSLVIEYTKEGDSLSEVEVRAKGSNEWLPMKESEAGVWKVESSKPLEGPFNFRFLSKKGSKNVFDDVHPWQPASPDFISSFSIY